MGCEHASIFTALGVDVTLIDQAPRLAPFLDAGISNELARCFASAGMRVVLDEKLVFARADRKLLGAHLLGEGAAELVHQGKLLLHFEASIDHLINMTFNVPTFSDAYKYAAYNGLRRPAGG